MLAGDAAAKIQELNTRLAKKDFETAELYMKMEYYKSAAYYYNTVFEKYHDTPYGEQALLGKVRALLARKKYSEALPGIVRDEARQRFWFDTSRDLTAERKPLDCEAQVAARQLGRVMHQLQWRQPDITSSERWKNPFWISGFFWVIRTAS